VWYVSERAEITARIIATHWIPEAFHERKHVLGAFTIRSVVPLWGTPIGEKYDAVKSQWSLDTVNPLLVATASSPTHTIR
jgi:hypothetical protein